jgi:hypothetical protein
VGSHKLTIIIKIQNCKKIGCKLAGGCEVVRLRKLRIGEVKILSYKIKINDIYIIYFPIFLKKFINLYYEGLTSGTKSF